MTTVKFKEKRGGSSVCLDLHHRARLMTRRGAKANSLRARFSRVGRAVVLTMCMGTFAVASMSAQSLERPRYEIQAEVRFASQVIEGTAAIALPPTIAGGELSIEVGRQPTGLSLSVPMEVLAVRTEDGQPVAYDLDEERGLATLHIGSTNKALRLLVEYRVPLNPTSKDYQGHFLYTDSGPGSHWYPFIRSSVGSPAPVDLEMKLTLPPGSAALSCTRPTTVDSLADGSSRLVASIREVEACPLAVGEGFRLESRTVGGTTLAVFDAPEGERGILPALEPAAQALLWLQEQYGFFPFDYIGILPASRGSVGATALGRVIWLHRGNLSPQFLQSLLAHELGHFYWGYHVRSSSGEKFDWLTLANGIWIDHLYLARGAGHTIPEQWLRQPDFNRFEAFLTARLRNYDQRLGLDEATWGALPYNYNSYVRHGKAAVGVYLLAQRLGSERFIAVQRDLLRRYQGRPLSAEAFGTALEAAGLPGATKWLEEWMRGDATIEYAVDTVQLAKDSTSFTYDIALRRLGTVEYPVQVVVVDVEGAERRLTLNGGGSSMSVTLDTSIDRVLVDPEGIIPMLSSDNAAMRRLIVGVLLRSGLVSDGLALARQHLRSASGRDDDRLRATAVSTAYREGLWRETVELWGESSPTCSVRWLCEASLDLASALIQIGGRSEAERILDVVQTDATLFGMGARLSDLKRALVPDTDN